MRQHGAGGHAGVVFFYAAYHSAHVLSFQHHRHATWVENILNEMGNLLRHALLYLQTVGEHIHDARDFGEADDLTGRNVGDMCVTEKGQHVVFAQAGKLDVADDHHIVIVHVEYRIVYEFGRVGAVAIQHFFVHFGDAVGRVEQPFAVNILTYRV